jgi:hypothetical protein
MRKLWPILLLACWIEPQLRTTCVFILVYFIIYTVLQVGHWTLDNAQVNKAFMVELAKLYEKRDLQLDPDDARIMCFPHVINICVQHLLSKITSDDRIDSDTDSESESVRSIGDSNRDPVVVGRAIVNKIRSSGKRKSMFEECIRAGNKLGWFIVEGKVTQLPVKELLHDVKTRWDSTYEMLHRLRDLRPVCFILIFLYLPN